MFDSPLEIWHVRKMFPVEPGDDPQFLEMAAALVLGSLESYPQRVCLVKIDNWFDAKWLGFTGKALGALGVSHPQDLRLPPFHPNRVVSQVDLILEQGDYVTMDAPPVHLHQKSEDNFQRRALRVLGTQSARLAWYSGNSLSNRRGSLMVYDFRADGHEPWYVELSHGDPWRVERRRGVSAGQTQAFAEVGKELLAQGAGPMCGGFEQQAQNCVKA